MILFLHIINFFFYILHIDIYLIISYIQKKYKQYIYKIIVINIIANVQTIENFNTLEKLIKKQTKHINNLLFLLMQLFFLINKLTFNSKKINIKINI